jgi:hypothetical protein
MAEIRVQDFSREGFSPQVEFFPRRILGVVQNLFAIHMAQFSISIQFAFSAPHSSLVKQNERVPAVAVPHPGPPILHISVWHSCQRNG